MKKDHKSLRFRISQALVARKFVDRLDMYDTHMKSEPDRCAFTEEDDSVGDNYMTLTGDGASGANAAYDDGEPFTVVTNSRRRRNKLDVRDEPTKKESSRGLAALDVGKVSSSIGRISSTDKMTHIVRVSNKLLFEKHVLSKENEFLTVVFKQGARLETYEYNSNEAVCCPGHDELCFLPCRPGMPVAIRHKPMAHPDYLGPITLVSLNKHFGPVTSSSDMGPDGYKAYTADGFCVSPVFSTKGTNFFIGVHFLGGDKTNKAILFTKEIVSSINSTALSGFNKVYG